MKSKWAGGCEGQDRDMERGLRTGRRWEDGGRQMVDYGMD